MTSLETIVNRARRVAKYGSYSGHITSQCDADYFRRCTHDHLEDGYRILFTRDVGMHSSGWWKNPDYERCYHLSISFFEPPSPLAIFHQPVPRDFDFKHAEVIAREFFRENVRMLWVEPPFSTDGKNRGVHHYRLFCDPAWQPILPRGEVYSRDWTPAEWKSWSDVHGDNETQRNDDGGHS